ncbi:hypothetical protein [Chamaesiphon minutus]|nr:hypothetical protein [Chamaesiphon minutus]
MSNSAFWLLSQAICCQITPMPSRQCGRYHASLLARELSECIELVKLQS